MEHKLLLSTDQECLGDGNISQACTSVSPHTQETPAVPTELQILLTEAAI